MVNEDTIKKRIAALESDIKVMTNTIQELDAKKQEAIANLNALHGAKQQCESFLKELSSNISFSFRCKNQKDEIRT